MIGRWSSWKPFPDVSRGGHIEAPIGPGMYEVCHVETGEQIAFGYSKNVAEALSKVVLSPGSRSWPFFRIGIRPRFASSEIEYRTCPAGSLADAKTGAGQMSAHRQAVLRHFAATPR